MSEKIEKKIEVSSAESVDQAPDKVELHIESVEQAEAKQSKDLEAARSEVDDQSTDSEKVRENIKAEESEPEESSPAPVTAELKRATFRKEIKHIRTKLNPLDKVGSKVIHQPTIRAVSEISSKTVARPSGLLGGGIVALLGTGMYLYLTKHIGFKYNYTVFLLLLVSGFVVGVIIEAAVRLLTKKHSAKY